MFGQCIDSERYSSFPKWQELVCLLTNSVDDKYSIPLHRKLMSP